VIELVPVVSALRHPIEPQGAIITAFHSPVKGDAVRARLKRDFKGELVCRVVLDFVEVRHGRAVREGMGDGTARMRADISPGSRGPIMRIQGQSGHDAGKSLGGLK